jgi:hypothetical protein
LATPNAFVPGAGRPDLHIRWAPPGSPPDASDLPADGPVAAFESLDGSGFAIVRSVAGGGELPGETVTYRHRYAEPPDCAGVFGDAPYLLSVRLYAPEEYRDDVRRWLDEEHAARQLSVSGTYWYDGYEARGDSFAFLNLWGLRDPGVIETPEWAAMRDTPWRERLMPGMGRMDRAVYRRLTAETPASGPEAHR